MAWNGAGTFLLDPAYSPEINGTVIDAVRYNGLTTDIAAGITVALAKDGQNSATANIPFGGFKATGLGAATSAGDATRFEQVYIRGEANIATAATCSIFALTETTLNLTGVTTVTSFGAGTAGDLKLCTAVAAFQITYDVVNLITPGLTNLAIAAGDWFMVKSKGGSAAEVVQLTRRASLTTRISDLGAAAAANTIANATYQQTWGWSFTGAGQKGLVLTGTSNTGTTGTVLSIEQASVGQAAAVMLDVIGSPQGAAGFPISLLKVSNSSLFLKGWDGYALNAGGTISLIGGNAEVDGGTITITGGNSTDGSATYNGGDVNITGGAANGGTGGDILITPGSGGTAEGVLRLRSPDTVSSVVTIADPGITLSSTAKVVIDTTRLVFDNTNGAPTISAGGGAGATISGSDNAFEVVIGTGSPTSVTITFADAKLARPQIVIPACSQAGCRLNYASTTTTVQILTDSAWSAGITVCCIVAELQ